jgi:hypothetical protein
MGTVERIVTNFVNANLWRGRTFMQSNIKEEYLSKAKHANSRQLLMSTIDGVFEKYPDIVSWTNSDDSFGLPGLEGNISLVIMDENTFRERVTEMIYQACKEVRVNSICMIDDGNGGKI